MLSLDMWAREIEAKGLSGVPLVEAVREEIARECEFIADELERCPSYSCPAEDCQAEWTDGPGAMRELARALRGGILDLSRL